LKECFRIFDTTADFNLQLNAGDFCLSLFPLLSQHQRIKILNSFLRLSKHFLEEVKKETQDMDTSQEVKKETQDMHKSQEVKKETQDMESSRNQLLICYKGLHRSFLKLGYYLSDKKHDSDSIKQGIMCVRIAIGLADPGSRFSLSNDIVQGSKDETLQKLELKDFEVDCRTADAKAGCEPATTIHISGLDDHLKSLAEKCASDTSEDLPKVYNGLGKVLGKWNQKRKREGKV